MKRLIVLFALFAACSAAAQQDTLFISGESLLEQYRAKALEYNDNLKAAEKHITASIELTKAARADRGPKLSAGADISYTGNPMELSLSLPGTATPASFRAAETSYGFSATLLQPIYTGGRILESIRIAESEKSMAESNEELIRSLVCYQTDVQYWNTVARAEVKNIAYDFRNSVADLTRIVSERVEAGMSDRQELLTVEVKLNEAEYLLLQAQSGLEIGLMALNSLIGEPLDAPTKIEDSVSPVEGVTSTLAQSKGTRPELKIAQEQIRFETSALKLTDAQYKPQFYVGVNGGYYSPGYNFHSDLSPNYTAYAKISVPIFEWGKRHSQKRASQQRIGIAADNLHNVETTIELETRTAWTALTQATQRVELTKSSLGKACENERRATEKYEEGKISVSEVIDAQVYRQTAQMNYVEAKVAAQMHYSDLQKAVNGY